MKNALSCVALASTIALAPQIAAAQSSDFHYNIAAGLTLPTASYADRNDAGFNAVIGVGMTPRTSQLGFRAEGIYNEFNQKFGGGKTHAGGVTANLTYDLMMPSARPSNTVYLIGGLGYYSTREPAIQFESESNIGWNVGAGFRFPLSGFSAYFEARFHSVSSDLETRFIPLSFGLVF